MFRTVKGVAKLGVVAGLTYVAGAKVNEQYHTENPSQRYKAATDAIKAEVAEQGFTANAITNHCQIGESVYAYHHEAERPNGVVGFVTGSEPSSTSVRGLSLFDRVAFQSISNDNKTTFSVDFNKR